MFWCVLTTSTRPRREPCALTAGAGCTAACSDGAASPHRCSIPLASLSVTSLTLSTIYAAIARPGTSCSFERSVSPGQRNKCRNGTDGCSVGCKAARYQESSHRARAALRCTTLGTGITTSGLHIWLMRQHCVPYLIKRGVKPYAGRESALGWAGRTALSV